LKGLLSSRDRVELDVDIALRVGVDGDMDNLSVLLVALVLDLSLEILGPGGAIVLQLPARG
jgi:hypothetical protein|tara:strand:+ start:8677 stop:8859 length:183 start_codon:yes stop_codon:yes gene_type:complete